MGWLGGFPNQPAFHPASVAPAGADRQLEVLRSVAPLFFFVGPLARPSSCLRGAAGRGRDLPAGRAAVVAATRHLPPAIHRAPTQVRSCVGRFCCGPWLACGCGVPSGCSVSVVVVVRLVVVVVS